MTTMTAPLFTYRTLGRKTGVMDAVQKHDLHQIPHPTMCSRRYNPTVCREGRSSSCQPRAESALRAPAGGDLRGARPLSPSEQVRAARTSAASHRPAAARACAVSGRCWAAAGGFGLRRRGDQVAATRTSELPWPKTGP